MFSVPFSKAEEIKRAISLNSMKGGATYEEIERSYESLVLEMQKTREVFEHSFGTPVSQVVLAGGSSLIEGIEEYVERKLSLECKRTAPWSNITTPAFLDHLMQETGPEFCVAIGLALRKIQNRD
jgi:Tfp pilus assembly PilM family ATPase